MKEKQTKNLTGITNLQVKTLYNKSPFVKVKLSLLETCYSCYINYTCYRYLLYLLYLLHLLYLIYFLYLIYLMYLLYLLYLIYFFTCYICHTLIFSWRLVIFVEFGVIDPFSWSFYLYHKNLLHSPENELWIMQTDIIWRYCWEKFSPFALFGGEKTPDSGRGGGGEGNNLQLTSPEKNIWRKLLPRSLSRVICHCLCTTPNMQLRFKISRMTTEQNEFTGRANKKWKKFPFLSAFLQERFGFRGVLDARGNKTIQSCQILLTRKGQIVLQKRPEKSQWKNL